MGAGHDHGTGDIKHERPLWWAFGLTAAFLIAEVIGGLLTNRLALLSDAAHMATDVIALTISLVAVRLSRKPPDAKRTYGYARMEAIGAMINGGLFSWSPVTSCGRPSADSGNRLRCPPPACW